MSDLSGLAVFAFIVCLVVAGETIPKLEKRIEALEKQHYKICNINNAIITPTAV